MVMFALAGLFALQNAHLIAVLQILIYAGAIMVLFVFVIMLLNLREKGGMLTGRQPLFQGIAVAVLAWPLIFLTANYDSGSVANMEAEATDGFGKTAAVGELLYTDYLLPFEIASVLLLAGLVGAVILTKTKQR
jgi:NADH-quinone oxidoreductase subunit J